ncbi:MAG: RNase adapter RapZ [Rhodobacteraceae bacterium]|nr:RNase adapter RapZ [Paracoccaceae bacterium]
MSDTGNETSQQKVVIVTGPSGAGRSTAISALEDMGYEVIDNMPLSLIPRLLSGPPLDQPLALGIDARNRDFSPDAILDLIDELTEKGSFQVECLYLDCQPDVLLRRFSETRRRHPLTPTGSPEQGIAQELGLLVSLRARADLLIDTTTFSPHDLREELRRHLCQQKGGELAVTVQSFSFKRGMPRGLDMAFDVRFLRNPHWDPELRPLDGRDQAVGDYIRADDHLAAFEDKLSDLITFLLPNFAKEGKSHLSIGIGCTGGQHRSVFVTENLAKMLADAGWQVSTRHRELSRRARTGAHRTDRGKKE